MRVYWCFCHFLIFKFPSLPLFYFDNEINQPLVLDEILSSVTLSNGLTITNDMGMFEGLFPHKNCLKCKLVNGYECLIYPLISVIETTHPELFCLSWYVLIETTRECLVKTD